MTLELRIPFKQKKSAKSFQAYLKENGCPSRIVTDSKYGERKEYFASMSIIEKFLDNYHGRNPNGKSRGGEIDNAIEKIRDWLSVFKGDVETLYSMSKVGVPCRVNDYLTKRIGDYAHDIVYKNDGYVDMNKSIKRFISAASVLIVLEKNGCISNKTDKNEITLTVKKPIDELVLWLEDKELFGSFDPEDLQANGIDIQSIKTIEYRYTVKAGPEFIKLNPCSITTIIELDRYGLDEHDDELDDALNNMNSCVDFVDKVLDLVKDGYSTIQEIQNGLSDSYCTFGPVYHVPDDYFQGVLSDLESLGFITIKNGVIKSTKKSNI